MNVTLGGDRLGSGNKNKVHLRNYERSTHNLSTKKFTSMAPGVLYPVYCNVALNGDTFYMNINADTITLPTTGPLFGTFKLQVDVFQCPIRLYQGILHNNPLDIGLKMSQVKLPQILLGQYVNMPQSQGPLLIATKDDLEFNPSCLMTYLGVKGIGLPGNYGNYGNPEQAQQVYRTFNAIPPLAYYDIFKNYYANKQEENAYVITPKDGIDQKYTSTIDAIYLFRDLGNGAYDNITDDTSSFATFNTTLGLTQFGPTMAYTFFGRNLKEETIRIKIPYTDGSIKIYSLKELVDLGCAHKAITTIGNIADIEETDNTKFQCQYVLYSKNHDTSVFAGIDYTGEFEFSANTMYETDVQGISLRPFALKNIDEMRMELLSQNELGVRFLWDYNPYNTGFKSKMPFIALTEYDEEYPYSRNVYPMNGLCVKTYQSDKYNNWVQTDWIDGDNGIAAITSVDTTGNSFTMDALLLAQKTYDMLNRIAVSGGTYEDWQEAVYAQKAIRKAETPMYCGGFSSEVVFEQVVQTSGTDNTNKQNALGNLGGKGRLVGSRYGKLHIKVNEPSFIIAIASLTPRIQYSQGNKWYMTDLKTIDDLHKPALDGIGFQELITEQMAWFDTHVGPQTAAGSQIVRRRSAGKVPAWQNYMTDTDEVFGDFADLGGTAYMVLNRRYGFDEETGQIQDLTTYIDPQKFNYAFAYSSLDAQNFWTEINFDIKARRKMSAKIMPNL